MSEVISGMCTAGITGNTPAGRVVLLLLLAIAFFALPRSLYAQFNSNDVKNLVLDVNDPADIITVPVPGEGFYLVWQDQVEKRSVLRFAYYNNNGAVQMRADGKSVTFMPGKKEYISAHLTVANHLMIIWKETDAVEGELVYVQRVTPNGLLLFGDKGKRILGPLKDIYGFAAEVSDSGDCFVAYALKQGKHQIMYSKTGLYENPENNKANLLYESPKAKHLLTFMAVQGGGVFLSWIEEDKIYTQYIEQDGETPWGDEPKQITSNADNTVSFRTLSVADSVVYYCYQTLTKKGSVKSKNLAQTAVTKSGRFFWNDRPVQMLASKGNPANPQLALAADSSVLVSFVLDNSSNQGSLVQKVERKTGRLLWGINGKPVEKKKAGIHPVTRIVSDGRGGAIVSWLMQVRGEKPRPGKDSVAKKTEDKLFVYAQRLNRKGEMMWDSTGKVISGSDEKDKSYLNLISDGVNGGIFTYKEKNKYASSIYGRRLFATGSSVSRFTEFSHTLSGDTLMLFWRPLEDVNALRFIVEEHPPQSEDEDEDTAWVNKASVAPDPLKPNRRYSFAMTLPSPGQYTFRVGIVTQKGDTVYSDPRSVNYSYDDITGEEDLYNYPNPFSDKTTIYFTLASPTPVKFEFYNTSMERIKEMRVERTFAGKNGIEFSAEGLKSGIYFYKMIIGKYAIVRKFLVAK